jgi:hypothetical protein
MLVKDATNWPPRYGGASEPGGDIPDFGGGTLHSVYENNCITGLIGEIAGFEQHWHLRADDDEAAEKIAETLRRNLGQRLAVLGDLEISAPMSPAGG